MDKIPTEQDFEEACADIKWAKEAIREALHHIGQARYYLRQANLSDYLIFVVNCKFADVIEAIDSSDDALRTLTKKLDKELYLK